MSDLCLWHQSFYILCQYSTCTRSIEIQVRIILSICELSAHEHQGRLYKNNCYNPDVSDM